MNRENINQISEFYVKAKALADGLFQAPGTRAAARRAAIAILACLAVFVAGCGTLSPHEDDDYGETAAGSASVFCAGTDSAARPSARVPEKPGTHGDPG